MEKEKLDQITIDLDNDLDKNTEEETIYIEPLKEETSIEESAQQGKKSKKRTKRQKEPQTISIEESYYIDEDGDKIAPPNREIFEKMTGGSYNHSNTDDVKHHSQNEELSDNGDVDVKRIFKIKSYDNQQKKTSNAGDNAMEQSSSEIETRQGDIYSDDYEYTERGQRKNIIGMYKFAKKNIKTKIVLVSILTTILFLIEYFDFFVKTPIEFLSNPYVLTISNIVVLLACAALSYEQLYHGAKSIFSKDYIPESVAFVSVLCSIVHSLLMLLFISFESDPNQYKLYNFPTAVVLICVLVYSYLNVSREKYGFGVISSKDIKYYLEKATRGDDSETETFSSSFDEFEGEIAKIKKTVFVSKYFANTNTPPKLSSYLSIYLTCSLLVSTILAVVSLFNNYGFFRAVSVWYICVLFTLPIGVLFSYSVPFLSGNKYLYDDETAIIGENAISEFATTDTVFVN
ncbi:MAG: hypothetical protein IKA02_02820, partial [Clostridia bacterium]|nr:hypothetical protein [Clostridia bacterium]